MQLHFLRKSDIGQTNVTRVFSSHGPLPWLNSDSFPPRPVILITSGIINTKFDRRLQPLTVDLSIITFCVQEPIILVRVRSRSRYQITAFKADANLNFAVRQHFSCFLTILAEEETKQTAALNIRKFKRLSGKN